MNEQTQVLRHIGKITNTNSNVVVVMPSINDKEDHALVVEIDALPPKFSDSFTELVYRDGQKSPNLAELLHERSFPTGERMLSALHNNGYLRAVPITRVQMKITNHDLMPLISIVNAMREDKGLALLPTSEVSNDSVVVSDNEKSVVGDTRNPEELIEQAREMEKNARALRKKAKELSSTTSEE